MSLIACKDLELAYEGRCVVSELNFQVEKGDYLCIVGENGSGKSTLMKTLLGLKDYSRGTITFGDGLKPDAIGYLPQQTEVQKDFPASVNEVVLSGCLNRCGIRPFYTKTEKDKASQNMERLGIKDLSRRCYRELSGGQQQRTLLARALCAADQLLVLDEPVSGLDPNATADMYELIESLNKKDNTTIIMVSHDIEAAVKYGTHILHVSSKPLFFGRKEDYLRSDTGKIFTERAGVHS
ncbi:MAG: metal ABC transporter ATP-binding protein [Lachnospiraceae bacterium]